MMKFWNFSFAIFLFLLISTVSFSQINAPVQFKTVQILRDKNRNQYELREFYNINHGISSTVFEFGKAGSYQQVYSGQSFGEESICPSDVGNNSTTISIATLNTNFFVSRINSDQTDDLQLRIVEKDCNTGELIFIDKVFLSIEDGFITKEVQHREKLK